MKARERARTTYGPTESHYDDMDGGERVCEVTKGYKWQATWIYRKKKKQEEKERAAPT